MRRVGPRLLEPAADRAAPRSRGGNDHRNFIAEYGPDPQVEPVCHVPGLLAHAGRGHGLCALHAAEHRLHHPHGPREARIHLRAGAHLRPDQVPQKNLRADQAAAGRSRSRRGRPQRGPPADGPPHRGRQNNKYARFTSQSADSTAPRSPSSSRKTTGCWSSRSCSTTPSRTSRPRTTRTSKTRPSPTSSSAASQTRRSPRRSSPTSSCSSSEST